MNRNPEWNNEYIENQIKINNLVVFFGEFGWAVGSPSGFGTATVLTFEQVSYLKEKGLINEMDTH